MRFAYISFTKPMMKYLLPAAQRQQELFMFTRTAQLHDASSIHQLVGSCSHDGTLLPRTYSEICQHIDSFVIVETDDHQFAGCAALHIYGQHLAELRSIVVRPEIKGRGAGSLLVEAILAQASASGIRCVCLFTRIPEFFSHFQFHLARHAALRDKVLKDCLAGWPRSASRLKVLPHRSPALDASFGEGCTVNYSKLSTADSRSYQANFRAEDGLHHTTLWQDLCDEVLIPIGSLLAVFVIGAVVIALS